MINTQCEKYRSDLFNDYEVEHTVCFPDAIIDGVKKLYETDTAPPLNTQPSTPIPLESAKRMIIDALSKFDKNLGQRAEEILNDPNRVYLNEPGAMHCLQAGVTKHHLQQKGMWDKEDQESTDVINGNPYATIHLDYDGSINSVIYLAHELGHAIADDIQIERGNDFLNNPAHMEDVQAYFIQHIVRSDLEKNENPEIAQAAKTQYAQEYAQYKSYYETAEGNHDTVLHGRPPAFTLASAIAKNLTNNPELRAFGSQMLLGGYGPTNISQTLAAIDIERPEQLQDMLAKSSPNNHQNDYEYNAETAFTVKTDLGSP